MRAAAAAAGWRRAARCVRTAAHRGDTARPSRAVTASSSVARHVRIRMPHQQRRQTRPPQKRTNDSKKEPLQLLWLLAVTPSRKSYPYGRSLNAPPRRVCGPRAVVPKLLRPGCPIEIYMLRLCGPHAERHPPGAHAHEDTPDELAENYYHNSSENYYPSEVSWFSSPTPWHSSSHTASSKRTPPHGS